MKLKSADIIKLLDLQELPEEGGYFKRVYQSSELVTLKRGIRACGDGIYYLITSEQFSGLHKLLCDEMWHFYAGDPVEQIIFNESEFKEVELGNSNFNIHLPQSLVPAGFWQVTKLREGGEWALIGTNAFPAYDHKDFQMKEASELVKLHPEKENRIMSYVK